MSDVCLAYSGDQKSEILSIKKDFGTVLCGKEITEIFELENKNTVSVCFSIVHQDSENVFTISPNKLQVLPRKIARFKVIFKSHAPGIVHEKKYTVSDGAGIIAEFRARCTTLGPIIRPRRVKLKFYLLHNAKIQTKRFELENLTTCPTKFHFEKREKNLPFRIMQESGEILGKGKFVFDLKFIPSQFGIYRKEVYCLFQYHAPVIFTLIGIYKPQLKIEPNKLNFDHSLEDDADDNYQAFMMNLNENYATDDFDPCSERGSEKKTHIKFFVEDEDKDLSLNSEEEAEEFENKKVSRKEPYKAILSVYYLNMGSNSLLTNGIELINTSATKEFYFEWSNENGKYFSVFPPSGNLKEGKRLNLEVKFSPDLPDRLFHGELDARIFLLKNDIEDVSQNSITLPMTLNLSALGHSFSEENAPWLAQCEIEPARLVLPACVPGEVVYSTLLIKRFGHLPVMFEFIPPKETRMKIKPPIGYIKDSYQLCVVQFDAPTGFIGTYTESWKLMYNSATKYYDSVSITSEVENPIVTLGEENVFQFETTLLGGISKSSVSITNHTRLKIQYEFVIPEHVLWIKVPILTGELEPLSSAYMDIIFKPTETREYFDYIQCWAKTPTKEDYRVPTKILLQGSCQDGFLVATPAFHSFGKCLIANEINKKFNVFNFTPILMNFKLFVISDVFFESSEKYSVNIKPSRGSISGKSNIEVEVSVTSRIPEICKFYVKCQLLSSDAEDSVPCTNPRTLFTLELEAILPTFQIIDLNVEGGGPLISPDWLWKMLDIKGVNKALRSILPEEEMVVDVRLPDAAINAPTITVYMLIQAGFDYEVSAQILRTYEKHFNRRITATLMQADKENEMIIFPSTIHLKPRCQEIVKMELKYNSVGSTFYEWSIKLSLNRILTIRTVLNGLPNDETAEVSMVLEPELELRPIFIGDLNPPVQLFWLYNNTPNEACYVLDKTFLREMSQPFTGILNCLNASGVLPPYSSIPLILKFTPNEMRQYKMKTQICLKTDYFVTIRITGNGVLNHMKFAEFYNEETVPKVSLLKQFNIALQPSIKVITIKPFPTSSRVHSIFFLENKSENKVWAFQWHSFSVQNLICATVEPNEGRISPGKKILAKLTVKSFSQPSNITFSIPCDVIDYTELQAYERAIHMKEIFSKKCHDNFTITERGLLKEIPEVTLPQEPNRGHIFVTVRTNVVADDMIEMKLHPKDVRHLRKSLELQNFCFRGSAPNDEIVGLVMEVLERVVWNILNSQNFARSLNYYNERHGRVTYSEILPGNEKEMKELERRSVISIPKNLMQGIVENTIIDILCDKFGD